MADMSTAPLPWRWAVQGAGVVQKCLDVHVCVIDCLAIDVVSKTNAGKISNLQKIELIHHRSPAVPKE